MTHKSYDALFMILGPSDPTAYLPFDIDVSNTLKFLEKVNESSPVKITMTHIFTRATAIALGAFPENVGRICFGSVSYSIPLTCSSIVQKK